jgi:hypothetical protein
MRHQPIDPTGPRKPYAPPKLTKRDRLARVTAEDTGITGGKDPG